MPDRFKIPIATFAIFLLFGAALFYGGSGERKGVTFEFEEDVISAAAVLGSSFETFTHPELGFSVEYPKELSYTAFKEGGGAETIVFQKEGQDENTPLLQKLGFQIFIAPFDGELESLTKEHILEDLPLAMVEEPQEVLLGVESGGTETVALLFWSGDLSIGRTREVWFVHSGHLYEITTYEHLDGWLAKILSTFTFHSPSHLPSTSTKN